jgi:hypothetical protein
MRPSLMFETATSTDPKSGFEIFGIWAERGVGLARLEILYETAGTEATRLAAS